MASTLNAKYSSSVINLLCPIDVHESNCTVREALRFSAAATAEEVSLEEKYDYVEKIIDLLEMREIEALPLGK